jgi:dihydrolipoamide dehydrogenase
MEEEFDVAIIGAGPSGYVSAIRCAQLGLKTACIEKRMELGGTCLNVGCIPSKTLLHASETFYKVKHEGRSLGIRGEGLQYDFSQMMARKKEVVSSLGEGIKGLFKKNKVTHFTGSASFDSPHIINVQQGPTSVKIKAKNVIIATGSEPVALPFLPFDERKVVSSTGALSLDKVPSKLVVIGAGVIGVELGSVYSRLGSDVTFIEFMDRICPTLDASVSKTFQEVLIKQGMKFHLSSKVTGVDLSDKGVNVKVETKDGSKFELLCDVTLVCVGRRPFSSHLSLDKAGIELNQKRQIPVDGNFRTSVPHIYAVGDIIDGPMLAHKASEEGVAVAEIIANLTPHIDYASVPNVVYTYPEVAAVGLTEEEAKAKGFELVIGTYFFRSNPRAKCAKEEDGFVKVIADAKSDKLLGLHIIGPHASEMIAHGALAIEKRMTSLDIATSCFAHPTLSEAIKEAALSIHKRAIHK